MELKPIRQKVWKSGNSLVVTIDPVLCQALGISEGDYAWIRIENVEKSGVTNVSIDSLHKNSITESTLEKGMRIEIQLPDSRNPEDEPSWRKYRLIPIAQKIRHFFPGYKIPFEVESDMGTFDAHVSSAGKRTVTGDKTAGAYLKGSGLTRWFNEHTELESGDIIIFEVQDGVKKYKIYLRKKSRTIPLR